jgi:hypothetical protein
MSVNKKVFAFGRTVLKLRRLAIAVSPLLLLMCDIENTEAAVETTTAASPFTVGAATHATVTTYGPVETGDNGNGYPSGYIYNISGASNGHGGFYGGEPDDDYVFGDQTGPYTVAFTTATPVTLTGIALYAGADAPKSPTANRGISSFSFSAGGVDVVNDVSPVDISTTENLYTFPAITASSFVATFVGNPSAAFPGPRIFELDGIVPEPASISILALSGLGLFARRRRV